MTSRASVLLVGLLAAACGGAETLEPFAEALVVVDTDLPVPRIVSRLRIDLYSEQGDWFESRDIALPDPRDWPVSFSVYSDDDKADRRVWVRLRVYPEGLVRDYRGERFSDWGGAIDEPPVTDGAPRLHYRGFDVTPAHEPQPLVTVDRLLLLHLVVGVRGRVLVTLHGACAGTMAAFADRPAQPSPVIGKASSCIDVEKQRSLVTETALEDGNMDTPATSLQSTELMVGCGSDDTPERVCIPGASAILGSAELALYPDLQPLPERIVLHSPFWLDRYEVTVGRFRAALAAGFAPSSMPIANDSPLGSTVESTCSWSQAVLGREDYALSCVTWAAARELCKFAGGDLPTEAQWEHMATLSATTGRARYTWGDEPPTCDRASYGRLALAGSPGVCLQLGFGPEPIGVYEATDVTRQGVVGAAGSVSEWMLDDYQDYRGACWGDSPVHDSRCTSDDAPTRSLRGGSWAAPPTNLASAARLGEGAAGQASFIGFRCAYPVDTAP